MYLNLLLIQCIFLSETKFQQAIKC